MKTAHWIIAAVSASAIAGGAAAVVFGGDGAGFGDPAQLEPGVRELSWSDLRPEAPPEPEPPASVFAEMAADSEATVEGVLTSIDQLYGPIPGEERGLQGFVLHGFSVDAANGDALVTELDGERVRLPGYVVPLDFEFDADEILTTKFLLVPFVGACVHVPPPPPNQIVYVETEEPYALSEIFEAVYVTGVLTASIETTEMAEVGYTLRADRAVGFDG